MNKLLVEVPYFQRRQFFSQYSWYCPACRNANKPFRNGHANEYYILASCSLCGLSFLNRYDETEIKEHKGYLGERLNNFQSYNKDPLSIEIHTERRRILQGLRKTVSQSRKGKPRKQQWGFHIEHE